MVTLRGLLLRLLLLSIDFSGILEDLQRSSVAALAFAAGNLIDLYGVLGEAVVLDGASC